MNSQFFAAVRQLEVTPWIGTPYKDGMRNVKLGKFRYNIYYRENDTNIYIVGICTPAGELSLKIVEVRIWSDVRIWGLPCG